jgi:hypothetical protein
MTIAAIRSIAPQSFDDAAGRSIAEFRRSRADLQLNMSHCRSGLRSDKNRQYPTHSPTSACLLPTVAISYKR